MYFPQTLYFDTTKIEKIPHILQHLNIQEDYDLP